MTNGEQSPYGSTIVSSYQETPGRLDGARLQSVVYVLEVANEDTKTLTRRAADGDQLAWIEIVRRFEMLVWSVTYEFRLPQAAREDVFQLTWLRLLDNLDRIREPDRLAGWLATTARRECLAVIRSSTRLVLVEEVTDRTIDESLDTALLANERLAAVAQAVNELGEKCQRLVRLLACDPPIDYVSIAKLMDIAVGSVGPTRKRCLDRLRSRPSVARLMKIDESGEDD